MNDAPSLLAPGDQGLVRRGLQAGNGIPGLLFEDINHGKQGL
jgi:hypothetical protein